MNLVQGRVMIFGTFDVFHPGHRAFIEQAGSFGKEFFDSAQHFQLVIVVARDETVKRIKGHLSNSEDVRLAVLRREFPEVMLVLGDLKDYLLPVREYRPSLVCLGYDQVGFSDQLVREFPEILIKRMEAFEPEKYKSSRMRRREGEG